MVIDPPFPDSSSTLNVKFPETVGVPLIVPLALNTRPVGNEPLANVNTNGGMPPTLGIVLAYAIPTQRHEGKLPKHTLNKVTFLQAKANAS